MKNFNACYFLRNLVTNLYKDYFKYLENSIVFYEQGTGYLIMLNNEQAWSDSINRLHFRQIFKERKTTYLNVASDSYSYQPHGIYWLGSTVVQAVDNISKKSALLNSTVVETAVKTTSQQNDISAMFANRKAA